MPTIEKLIDIINDFFGCDAAYYDVNPFDLATHLIENGVTIASDDFIISQVSQEEEEKFLKLLRECPVSVLPRGEELTIEFIGHEHKWIPVTERLPEPGVEVLCWYEYYRFGSYNRMFQTYGLGYYFRDGFWGGEVSNGQKTKVLAWMPLPEPPKEVL